MGRVLPYGFGGSIADCPRDSHTKSEIWMAMDIGRSSLINETEKNQRISGDFCWKIICSHGNRRWRRSVLPQAGGAPCPTFTRQGEQWHGDNGYFTCDRGWLMSWPQWISTLVQSLPIRHHSLGLTGSQMREQEDNGEKMESEANFMELKEKIYSRVFYAVSRWMSIYVLKTLIGDQREPLRAARDDFENSHK